MIFFAGPFFKCFYDLGMKKGGPCPKSRVGPLSESDNMWMGKYLGLKKGGPYSGMVRFVTRSDTGSPLYHNKVPHQRYTQNTGFKIN